MKDILLHLDSSYDIPLSVVSRISFDVTAYTVDRHVSCMASAPKEICISCCYGKMYRRFTSPITDIL